MIMNKMSIKSVWILIVLLWAISIIWDVYSYLCIGIIHQYNMSDVVSEGVEVLGLLWNSMLSYVITCCAVSALCCFLFLLKKDVRIRLILYVIALFVGVIFCVRCNILCGDLLELSPGASYEIDKVLQPGYNLFFIVNLCILSLSVVLEYWYDRHIEVMMSH